jgi:hypothetical protein
MKWELILASANATRRSRCKVVTEVREPQTGSKGSNPDPTSSTSHHHAAANPVHALASCHMPIHTYMSWILDTITAFEYRAPTFGTPNASPPAFKSTNRLQGSIMERVSGMAAPSAGPLSLVLTFNLIFVVAVPPVVGWFKTMPVEFRLATSASGSRSESGERCARQELTH